MLRRLGLVLAGTFDVRHQRHVDEQAVLAPLLDRDLPDGLDERLRLDVTGRSADLRDDDLRVCLLPDPVDEILDLVGDVRDDLDRAAQVIAAPLFVEHFPVDLAGGDVGVFVEVFIDESLIVPEIEIGLSAVFGHVHLAVLVRTHRAGIHIHVRIELLRCHLQTARLEQPPQGRRRDALAEPRYNTACYEYILFHFRSSLSLHISFFPLHLLLLPLPLCRRQRFRKIKSARK